MTDLALVPPPRYLRDFNLTAMHLMLAHLCNDPEYMSFYREQALVGSHIILDNSAFELGNSAANMATLLALNHDLQCSEVVAPDSILNPHFTLARTYESIQFMSSLVGQHAWRRAGRPRIMVVPQVDLARDGIDEYNDLARSMLDLWHTATPYLSGSITLGVAKNFNRLHGGWMFLFEEVISELRREWPIDVHCLGLPKDLQTIKKVIYRFPFIRSIDTALPFVCAMRNHEIGSSPQLPKRPEDYMVRVLTEEQVQLAGENIGQLADILGLHTHAEA